MAQEHDFSTATSSGVTVGNTSTQILAATSGRRYAVLTNDSSEDIYISLGATAEMNKGIRLNKRGGVLNISGFRPFKGQINGICSSGGMNICVFFHPAYTPDS